MPSERHQTSRVAADDHPHMVDIFSLHVEPVLKSFFFRKLRTSLRINDESRINQDALEMISEAKLRIFRQLQSKSDESQNGIGDIEAYSRTVARNVFNQYLRNKYPKRFSIKNQCRYLLTHHPGFGHWLDKGVWLCGTAERQNADFEQKGGEISPELRSEIQAHIAENRVAFRGKEIIETVRIILQKIDDVISLDDLVASVVEILGIEEPTETAESDLSSVNEPSGSPVVHRQIEAKEFAARLWNAVLELPVRHRVALLLNFKDENGDDLAAVFPMLQVASIREIGEAVNMPSETIAAVWNELPWDDRQIAEHLGLKRQQVINLRQSAKQALRRKLSTAN
jgi:RNA polymerase sigma factor (sigma-70 family)